MLVHFSEIFPLTSMIFNLIKLLIFAAIFYMAYRLIKRSPPQARKVSLILFIIGIIAIELCLRLSGGRPYFTVSAPYINAFRMDIEADSIRDDSIMICDSFGVNKIHRVESLLNSEGFRSLYEFSQSAIDSIHARGRKAIFLIGDSYTYGLNADSGCSFASLLENYGRYGILNAGIPGTDATQYSAVVNEYIASGKIKPDEVVVCFSFNDLMHFPDRKLTPGIPMLFQTNVGALYSFQDIPGADTVFPTAKAAYQNIISRYTIRGVIGDGWHTDLIGKSVLASRMIGLFYIDHDCKKDTLGFFQRLLSGDHPRSDDPIYDHIKAIKKLCNEKHLPVIFVLLPDIDFVKAKESPGYDGVISIDPRLFLLDDFSPRYDDHPLNSGHKKIAIEIDKILSKN